MMPRHYKRRRKDDPTHEAQELEAEVHRIAKRIIKEGANVAKSYKREEVV